jgi:hypothetical protein
VPEPTSRRTVVPAWTRTARLFPERAHHVELRLHGRAPYSSISKGKIGVKTVDVLACVVPSYSALGRR